MNKKGFTLIELIVVISIMVAIGLVIATNMSALFSKSEEETYINFKKKIEDAACIYIERNDKKDLKQSCRVSSCNIKTKDLIESGLLEANLKDPNTGKMVKDSNKYEVVIKWEDYEKKCSLNIKEE